jgi:hypothetical protein
VCPIVSITPTAKLSSHSSSLNQFFKHDKLILFHFLSITVITYSNRINLSCLKNWFSDELWLDNLAVGVIETMGHTPHPSE